jgi:hypothetical protein
MKTHLTTLTTLTAVGLITGAIAIWIQWFSGDPAYRTFPPGPVFFVAIAALIFWGTRWWWTPLVGAMLSLLVTVGWFVLLPRNVLRLTHPGAIGNFAAGIFIGTLLQIVALVATDLVGLAATVQNYRRVSRANGNARMA